MSCGIHTVLQKLNKDTGEFEDILYNVLGGQNYHLFTFLSGVRGMPGPYDEIAHRGYPKDFKLTTKIFADGSTDNNYHNDHWMGDHSHGWLTLKEFCEAKLPDASLNQRFEVEQFPNGYTVNFLTDEESDEYASIRAYQKGIRAFFDTDSEGEKYGETYRLVFGYDS